MLLFSAWILSILSVSVYGAAQAPSSKVPATSFSAAAPFRPNVTELNALVDDILHGISNIHVQDFNDISVGNLTGARRQICVLTNAFYQCQAKVENVTVFSADEPQPKSLNYYFTINLAWDQEHRFMKITPSQVEVAEYQRPSKYLLSSLIRQFYNRVYHFYVRPSASAVTSASMVSHALKSFAQARSVLIAARVVPNENVIAAV